MEKKLFALNVDDASVNTGIHRRLDIKVKEDVPWLMLVHCFNHHLELTVKDNFNIGTFFDEIDVMLRKIYYLTKIVLKDYLSSRNLEAYLTKLQKPSKSTGMRWIAHKVRSMEIIVANCSIFMTHIESLSQTDSEALKPAEIEGLAKKWFQGKYLMHLAMFLDILTPIKVFDHTARGA